MTRHRYSVILGLMFSFFISIGYSPANAQEQSFDRKEDVIYGRKFGTALTMDVFTPKKTPRGSA